MFLFSFAAAVLCYLHLASQRWLLLPALWLFGHQRSSSEQPSSLGRNLPVGMASAPPQTGTILYTWFYCAISDIGEFFFLGYLKERAASWLSRGCFSSDSLIFGAITCVTGVLGVASGVQASRRLRTKTPRADPLVCAAGLLLSAPFLYLAIVFAQASTIATYVSICHMKRTFL